MSQEGRELDAHASRRWDEMLDEFRALGGVADNVRLAQGRFGRGLFPIDPSKPVKVHVPDSLLIDLKQVVLENDAFRVGPAAEIGAREKVFWENYQRDFSWGTSGGETRDLLQMVQEAPKELREILAAPFKTNLWLGSTEPRTVAERYLATRVVRYKGGHVVMPVVELANHGHPKRYEIEDGKGVGLSGHFSREILVRYGTYDPLELFINWGFASDNEEFALSLNLANDRLGFSIGREDIKSPQDMKSFIPRVSRENGKLTLSHLLLGHKRFPRVARGIFARIMRNAGRSDAEEVFDGIQHANRMQYYRLIELSEGAAPALGRLLRDVARYQLDAMSNNYGKRDV